MTTRMMIAATAIATLITERSVDRLDFRRYAGTSAFGRASTAASRAGDPSGAPR